HGRDVDFVGVGVPGADHLDVGADAQRREVADRRGPVVHGGRRARDRGGAAVAGVPLYPAAVVPGTTCATIRWPLWSRCSTLRPMAAMCACRLTMFTQTASAASVPSSIRTPRA